MTANPDKMLEAATSAVCAMGVCGELAYERLGEKDGNSTYRNYIIDEIFHLDGQTLEEEQTIRFCRKHAGVGWW